MQCHDCASVSLILQRGRALWDFIFVNGIGDVVDNNKPSTLPVLQPELGLN